MKHYTAAVEVSRRGNMTADEVDATLDRLAGQDVSFSVSPHGYLTGRITLPADNLAAASTAAVLAITHGLGLDVADALSVHAMGEDEADTRDSSARVPALIGVAEAAELLKKTPQRVRQMIDEGKLPAHRVGERSFALVRSEVEAFAIGQEMGVPGLGPVIRSRGFELGDVISGAMVSRFPEYRWRQGDGEVIETQDPPPPGTSRPEQRVVSRYLFTVKGEHEGGTVRSSGDGITTTTLEQESATDWAPLV